MHRFNFCRLSVVFAALFACGAPEDEAAEGLVLGTGEQAYLTLNSPTYQFGTKTSAARQACTKTDAAQTCTIPQYKKIEIARTPGSWTGAELTRISSIRQALGITFDQWQFTVVDSATSPGAGFVRIVLAKGAVAGSNGLLDTFRTVSFFSNVALTEGTGGALPVGQYQRHGSCSAVIDTVDLYARGANATQDNNLFDQAVANSILVCMGVGVRDDLPNTWSMRDIATYGLATATTGEVCKANNYSDLTDQADFSTSTFSACPTN